MNRIAFALFFLVLSTALGAQQKSPDSEAKEQVGEILDRLNQYAHTTDFDSYFSLFADQSTFVGTDATEVWNKQEFMEYARPHFKKGKAWSFTSLKRNIVVSHDTRYAWFNELLSTQMLLCRGSGILEKINGTWQIRQFVLSMTIPNEVVSQVVEGKKALEEPLIENLNQKTH